MSDFEKDHLKIFYALSLAWQLGFIIAVPIGGFLILGLWLDKKLSTFPILLIMGIIIGMVITVYEVYHLFIPLFKNSGGDNQ